MSTYYVASNLTHDGTAYMRGDTIELEDASALLSAGVLQTEPIAAPAPAQDAPVVPEQPQAADAADAGGQATVSGEPSLDGKEADDENDQTEEVGPHAQTSEAATVVASAPAQDAPSPRRGRRNQPEAPVESAKDPSANL
jgi:hypothetical protein